MEHKFTNRLIHEKSPYLLQHAHNPVDWYPWGDEAFDSAKELDRPIFLSIGYSTCHWCHVMEKESFEDTNIAKMLNQTFICVKVDREEHPEVDSLYMEFAQSMIIGSAGWPLNVILTPELKPFFAATYLPPFASHGLMGLSDLIKKVHELWSGEERFQVELQGEKIFEVFSHNIQNQGEELPSRDLIEEAAELLFTMADPVYGGIKGKPKFPVGYQWSFMLRYSFWQQDSRALFIVEKTLEMMHRGGIYDHLGGGFSRYSIDEEWMVPHFEKMLYDNALLAHAYLEAWQVTKNPLYEKVCREVLSYVFRELRSLDGGFYSAEDADLDGIEGGYYTWSYEEIQEVLGPNDAPLFCSFYGVSQQGNFEGKNILHMTLSEEEYARQHQIDLESLKDTIEQSRMALLHTRNHRKKPFKDTKILSSWNGLIIATLAEAGCAFDEGTYLKAADKGGRFILDNMLEGGRLSRMYRDGEASQGAGLDEYAFLIKGLLALFEAGLGSEWFRLALMLNSLLETEFKSEEGAYYQTDGADSHLILRRCQLTDGAEPSGNAVQCENLLKFYQFTGNIKYKDQAADILKAVANQLEQYAQSCCYHLLSLDRFYDNEAPTIVMSLNEKGEHFDHLRHFLFQQFIPHKAVIWVRPGDRVLMDLLPALKQQPPINQKTTLYICKQGVCLEPITNLDTMQARLAKLK